MSAESDVWVFNGVGGRFPGGVFSSLEEAETAIKRQKLSGTLTRYPVGQLVYEWALAKGMFKPKRPDQQSAKFIGGFTTASQEHYHYDFDSEDE
jgi:hypothetical protein